jgi:hypothetical protein
LTHADVTLRNVSDARATPTFTASSKPVAERAEISVTRATSLITHLQMIYENRMVPRGQHGPFQARG